jgi:hypothetical protein
MDHDALAAVGIGAAFDAPPIPIAGRGVAFPALVTIPVVGQPGAEAHSNHGQDIRITWLSPPKFVRMLPPPEYVRTTWLPPPDVASTPALPLPVP